MAKALRNLLLNASLILKTIYALATAHIQTVPKTQYIIIFAVTKQVSLVEVILNGQIMTNQS